MRTYLSRSVSASLCASGLVLLPATASLGQDLESMVGMETEAPYITQSLEVSPLPLMASAVPGVGAVGGGIELRMHPHWAAVAEAGYMHAELDQRWTGTIEEQTDSPALQDGNGYNVAAGARYYSEVIGDSFYADAKVGYGEAFTDWVHADGVYSTEAYTVSSTLGAGYRWVWANGFRMRTGVTAGVADQPGLAVMAKNEAATERGADDVAEVLDTNTMLQLDLALGYTL